MKKGLILGAVVLLLMGAGIWGCFCVSRSRAGTWAVVYQDNAEVQRIDLSEVKEPYTITLTGEDGRENCILVEPGGISMQSAECPDKICVRTGKIHASGKPIVCLPNRIVIEILPEGEEGG